MKHSSVPAYSIGKKYPAEPVTTDKLSPSPDTYNVRQEEIIVPARSFGRADRSMSVPKSSVPGPGSYEIKSFLDLSFNIKAGKKPKPPREKNDKSKIDMPGPASYNPRKPQTNVSFSMGNKTFSLINSEGNLLGPGQYSSNYDSIKPKTAVSFTKASREALQSSTSVPGPGAYSLKEIKEIPQYVFPRELREKRLAADYPGPGNYNIPGMSEELKHKMGKTILPRRPLIAKDQNFPGPGAYNSKYGDEMRSYSVGKGGRPALNRDSKNPGPGQYEPKNPALINYSKSIGTGNRPPLAKTNNIPGPGSYDFPSFTQNGPKFTLVGRKNEIKGFVSSAGPGQYDPDVNASRPDGVHVVIGTGQRTNESRRGVRTLPGPGAYDPAVKSDSPRWTFKKDPKDKINFEDEPGPGQYDIPPTVPDVAKYLLNNNRK
jgi:hypothetical protein